MAPGSDSGGIGGLIPDDVLLFQILVLLPVKCLVRFQSVCKLWRDTITSTSFARQQLERSKTRSSMVIMPRRSIRDHERLRCPAVSFYRFQPEQSKVAELILEKRYPGGIPMFTMPLHCDGLVMIPCLTGHIFVCNPATGELVELPRGSHSVAQDNRVAFGFDPRDWQV
uniref:F-box domain-containing protein n=1 Tax=Oryza punctata TaxID=4537 RepID=A0A0E0LHS1_ORYPU